MTREVTTWTRENLAEGLALLDNISLAPIRSMVIGAEAAKNWRKYLARADDLMAFLSLCVSTNGNDNSIMPIYAPTLAESENDNSKAVGDFTRVLKDQGMLDQDGRVKR